MYYVYFLKSEKNGDIYKGSTDNLKERFAEHIAGKVRSIKTNRPWKIVYYEAHVNKTLALKAELFYKSSQGRRQIKKKLDLN